MISLQNILSFFSLIVSSGAIGYAVRLVIKIEVLEHLYNEKKDEMEAIQERQTSSESDILRLKDSMGRIEISLNSVVDTCKALPSIDVRLASILEKVGQFVPRPEIDSKIERISDVVQENQSKIKILDSKLELSRRRVPDSQF